MRTHTICVAISLYTKKVIYFDSLSIYLFSKKNYQFTLGELNYYLIIYNVRTEREREREREREEQNWAEMANKSKPAIVGPVQWSPV